jgi:hypothetical protein
LVAELNPNLTWCGYLKFWLTKVNQLALAALRA